MVQVSAAAAAPTGWRAQEPLVFPPILSGARDAFYENGYHGTTVRDIARRSGTSVPALYYHHENKESMLVALLAASIERTHELALRALDAAGEDVMLRFANLVECLALFMTKSTKIAALDHEMRALSEENRAPIVSRRHDVEELVRESIVAGVEAGIFDVSLPKTCARALVGMIQSIAMWFRPGGAATGEEVAAQYVDIALHTVGCAQRRR